ncbi:REDY-like protein HapK [Colwellia chukchiensis]|uniref:REDY-like protein HapK n=1 Tax=Colwellia chukchiensis TaxID=641665 RepID=A0A1H7K5R7_9GAMM|nr:REDY-like protein HapK [Colwellia chukchiensis]SEK81846.1 REDY-like protein HapK [Colwellia chukchiensis]
MTTIIVLFNLKADVAIAEYERWAVTTDLPTAGKLPSVEQFKLLKAQGLLMSEDKPPYQYIEVLTISDMEQFAQDVASDAMQKIAGEFQSFAENPLFIMTSNVEV